MSQDLTKLESELKSRLPYCQSIAWASRGERVLRVKLRKETWHDTLILVFYVSENLLTDTAAMAILIESQAKEAVRSGAARYGWQRRRMREAEALG